MPLSLRPLLAALRTLSAARSAMLVFATLVVVYLGGAARTGATAGLTADATASSFLPAVLLQHGRLHFSAETTPALFRFEELQAGA